MKAIQIILIEEKIWCARLEYLFQETLEYFRISTYNLCQEILDCKLE